MNQLDEQVNESNFIIQHHKREKDQLHRLVNKFHESKNIDRTSDDFKTKEVGVN